MWADGYDRTVRECAENSEYPFAGYKEVLNTIYDRVKSAEGKTVLDIGFGTGVLTKKLYDEDVKIYGNKGLPLELKEKKFDFIISTYAIHHLTDKEKAAFIKELKGHLEENGEILIGDVAFETRKELELCKSKAGDDWDRDEIYIVKEELQKDIPGILFKKINFCSGVCVIKEN